MNLPFQICPRPVPSGPSVAKEISSDESAAGCCRCPSIGGSWTWRGSVGVGRGCGGCSGWQGCLSSSSCKSNHHCLCCHPASVPGCPGSGFSFDLHWDQFWICVGCDCESGSGYSEGMSMNRCSDIRTLQNSSCAAHS